MNSKNPETQQAVRVVAPEGQMTQGIITLHEWSRSERHMRALKAHGAMWLLALLALAIPMLHFILTPLFLVAGPVAGFVVHRQTGVISGGQVQCPSCKGTSELPRLNAQWPVFTNCKHCGSALRILEELPD